jgi:hypothetical protein
MIENYSGNIKIREKPSMQKIHKFLFCKLSRFRISEGKTNPLNILTKSTKLRTKPLLSAKKYEPTKSWKIPNSLANLLTSLVRPTDVIRTDYMGY